MHELPESSTDLVKVTIPLPTDAWHGRATETLWAEALGANRFRLRNVPFFVCGLSFGDVVEVSASEGVVQVAPSGHSTYRIFVSEGVSSVEEWLSRLHALGVTYERATQRLIALDVSRDADPFRVYALLELGSAEGIWDFEEGHYGHEQSARQGS